MAHDHHAHVRFLVDAGLDGDLPRAGRGLAMLRALGLGADADLAAAQLSLLPMMRADP